MAQTRPSAGAPAKSCIGTKRTCRAESTTSVDGEAEVGGSSQTDAIDPTHGVWLRALQEAFRRKLHSAGSYYVSGSRSELVRSELHITGYQRACVLVTHADQQRSRERSSGAARSWARRSARGRPGKRRRKPPARLIAPRPKHGPSGWRATAGPRARPATIGQCLSGGPPLRARKAMDHAAFFSCRFLRRASRGRTCPTSPCRRASPACSSSDRSSSS